MILTKAVNQLPFSLARKSLASYHFSPVHYCKPRMTVVIHSFQNPVTSLIKLCYIQMFSCLHCSTSEANSVGVSAIHFLTPQFSLCILAFTIICSGRNPSFSIVLRRNRHDTSPYIKEIQLAAIALNQGIHI